MEIETKHNFSLNVSLTLYFPIHFVLALLSSNLFGINFVLALLSFNLFFLSQSNSENFPNHIEITFLFLYCTFFSFLFCFFFFTFFSLFFGLVADNSPFFYAFPFPIQINNIPSHLVSWFCYKSKLKGQVGKTILGSV